MTLKGSKFQFLLLHGLILHLPLLCRVGVLSVITMLYEKAPKFKVGQHVRIATAEELAERYLEDSSVGFFAMLKLLQKDVLVIKTVTEKEVSVHAKDELWAHSVDKNFLSPIENGWQKEYVELQDKIRVGDHIRLATREELARRIKMEGTDTQAQALLFLMTGIAKVTSVASHGLYVNFKVAGKEHHISNALVTVVGPMRADCLPETDEDGYW